MVPRIIVGLIVFVSILLCKSPLSLGMFFLIVRPLIQPYAMQHIRLFPGVALTGSVAVVFILLTILICLIKKGYKLYFPKLIPIYLLLLFNVASFYNSVDVTLSISFYLKFATGVSMYLLIYNAIKTKDDANKVLFCIVIASIIPMIYGYYQLITQTASVDGTRVNSIFGMANAYGEFLSITFCGTLMLLLQKQTRVFRISLICIISSLIVSMLISRNRGQWIALSTGLIFASLVYIRRIKLRWFVIATVLIGIFFSGLIVKRFDELHGKNQWGSSKNTFANRMTNWAVSLSLVPNHAFIGHGVGNTRLVKFEDKGYIIEPHNDYIRLAVESGISGLLCYLAFLFVLFVSNLKFIFKKEHWYINYPMLVLIIYWSLHSITQNMLYSVVIFTLFMALIALSTKWNELISREGYGNDL